MNHQNERRSASDSGKRPGYYRSLASCLALCFFSNLLLNAASPQVSESGVGQSQKSARETTGPQDGTVDEKDVRPLEQGHAVKRELSGGQRHKYQLRLSADQFLKAIIEQQGIDIEVQISGPDGKQILEFDSELRLQGEEQASLVAEAAGDYQLVVQSKLKGVAAGSYEIRIEELRAATDNDRALHEADKLFSKATKLRLAGKFNEALSLFQRALEIRERILGPDHRKVALALNGLAVMYTLKSEFAKAEPLYQRAQIIIVNAVGPEHPDVAVILNNMAKLSYEIGEYEKAETLFQRARAIFEKALGPEHLNITVEINNLAALYKRRGDYAKAEPLYQRALTISEKVLGPEHPDITFPRLNLANLYREMGDYEKAEPLYRSVLTIREKALGPDHPDVARVLNNLANLYKDKGEYARAEPLYERTLAIMEKVLGPAHIDVAGALNNLANLLRERGEYARAEPLYQRALVIVESSAGPEHPGVAKVLNNLANLYCARGDFARAEPLYRSALTVREKTLGREHPEFAESLADLARLYAAKSDYAQAVEMITRANAIDDRNFTLQLKIGSERQKLIYLSQFSEQTAFTLSLQSQAAPKDSQALYLAFTTLLNRKARALDAMTDTIASLRRHAKPQDLALFEHLTHARSQLASLELGDSGAGKRDSFQTRVKALEDEVDKLEAELSSRSIELHKQMQRVSLSAVQSALPAGSALIEFVIFTPQDLRTGMTQLPRYLAYLLASRGQPKWVDLGEAAPIDRAVDAWRQSLRENGVDVKQLGRAVDELVMRPVRLSLQSESGQINHLLIAPDGSLNLIPFAALVDEENRYLIERYNISYLTSGGDLLRLHNPQPSRSAPLVLANPLFGKMVSAASRGTRNSVGDQGERRSDPARIFFPPLPGTEGEALAIKAMMPEASVLQREKATETVLKQIIGPQILHIATHGFYLDYQETDQEEDGKPDIVSTTVTRKASAQGTQYTLQLESTPVLEVARERTKRLIEQDLDAYILRSRLKGKGTFYRVRVGNFLKQAEAQKYGAGLQEKGVAGAYLVAQYKPPQGDLMEGKATIAGVGTKGANSTSGTSLAVKTLMENRSGLRLSKFAARVKDPLLRSGLALAGANEGKSGDDDGLLTALELAGLDLWGTKLVVLSACNTGVGEIKNGEGVQGLRRALVLAGSESQVISLWAVPDELAKDLIIPYYKALQRGEGRGEGLRQVQLQMLRSKELHHPFYWATFIQSGEWANLDGRR